MTVSFFESATSPRFRIASAPEGSQYIHYSKGSIELEKVFVGIKTEAWKGIIDSVKEKGYTEHKKNLPCFTPAGTFRIRCDWDMIKYSHIVHLDYDKVDNAPALRDYVASSPYCHAAFLSPSQSGVKVFVKVNSSADMHDVAFTQVKNVFDDILKKKSDPSVRNISRLCFVSHDCDLYYNETSKPFEVVEEKKSVYVPDASTLANDNSVFGWLYNLTMKGKYSGETLNAYGNDGRKRFLYVFACNCNRYGLDQHTALQYALHVWVNDNFNLSENEVTHAVTSAYRNRHEHSTFRLPKNLTA